MTLIVAGTLTIKPGSRDEFLEESRSSILLARNESRCEDFSVSPDLIDPNRVNIFEKWQSRPALDAFRNSGPETTLFSLVESFNVKEYKVDP